MPRKQNPVKNPSSGRAIARQYVNQCGWTKRDAKKVWKAQKGKQPPPSSRRAMNPNEQARWLKGALTEASVLALALCFALATGLRVSELVKVQRSDFGGDGFEVLGKGQKWRTVPINAGVKLLLPHLPSRGYLFPGRAGGHVAAATVEAACRRIGERLPDLAWVTPHVLRHTYTTNEVNRCVDPKALRDALGHKSLKTTWTYVSTIHDH